MENRGGALAASGGNLQAPPLGQQQMAAAPAQQSAWADYETVFTNAKAGELF